MSSTSLSMHGTGTTAAPLQTGVALAVTVAVFYVLCTLVWLAVPGPFLNFMNGLFHGIDFTPLMRSTPFAWGGFVEAVVVMTVWAFLAGTFFAWLRQRLGT